MKSFWWSIACCFMIAMGLQACEDPIGAETARERLGAAQFDTLNWEDFNSEERRAWDEATKSWYEKEYLECLKQYGFQVNCTDCTHLGVTMELKVDAIGKIVECKEISSKIYCSKHSEDEDFKVKDCVVRSFPTVSLPAVFFQKILTVFVGKAPMCTY
jgi:hypothetical protein